MCDLRLLEKHGTLHFDLSRLPNAFKIIADQFQKLKLLPQLFLLAQYVVFSGLEFKRILLGWMRGLHNVNVFVLLHRMYCRRRVLMLQFLNIFVDAIYPIFTFCLFLRLVWSLMVYVVRLIRFVAGVLHRGFYLTLGIWKKIVFFKLYLRSGFGVWTLGKAELDAVWIFYHNIFLLLCWVLARH